MIMKVNAMITLVAAITTFILAADANYVDTVPKVHTSISPVYIKSNHTFSGADSDWPHRVTQLRAVKVEIGCGRMQNRLVTFDDGSKACARYRLNSNLMQGEIYSYFLAKLLQIPNLPPLALTLPDLMSDQWSQVAASVLEANWQSKKLLILTKYISDSTEVVLPPKLRAMQPNSLSPQDITPKNMELIAQWSDMIVFDYIVGNMDRLINSLHNKQWNSDIMAMPVHNLAQKDNSLIFFDNEDGLFHGYKILDRYSQYHEQSLETVCVFRVSTAAAVTKLLHSKDIVATLTNLVQQREPAVLKYLPKLSSRTAMMLTQRLSNVVNHIKACEKLYPA